MGNPSLDDWFNARDIIRRLYIDELGRDVTGDPDALANWLYHWRDGRRDVTWIRDRIRESNEWKDRHGKPAPPVPVPIPWITPVDPNVATPGFVEHSTSDAVRSFTPDQIRSFLPTTPGGFTFPPPYNSIGVLVENVNDIEPAGYSYWRQINAHIGRTWMYVILGIRGKDTSHVGLYTIDKVSLTVRRLGIVVSNQTGEGCYFSAIDPDVLFVRRESTLYRVNVGGTDGNWSPVFDARQLLGRQDIDIWQVHSSGNELTHSCAVRQIVDAGAYPIIGWMVYNERTRIYRWIDVQDTPDECQIDKFGRYLLIKEGNDNRIVDLLAGGENTLFNADGAVGHSDMGYGYVVGEDNMTAQPGAMRRWTFGPGGKVTDGAIVYHMTGWAPMTRHVSHCNATPDGAQSVVISSASHDLLSRSNEIVVVPLDGSLTCRVVAPTLVDLNAPGGGDDYRKAPKANVDAYGEFALWTSNCGGDHLHALMVRL